ncbi:hypothetical protein Bca52824_027263 [Brassica carinata]|uniref:Uncharacterized protein n=1 Tax=Brassica carinata TaxID=52824 RepID=A0A8X7V8P8_BRACI|nr:hypothetical protein Bca52824_027263 [Brassica carinata]
MIYNSLNFRILFKVQLFNVNITFTSKLFQRNYSNIITFNQAHQIFSLSIDVITYNIWRQRNSRIFRNSAVSDAVFFSMVECALRDRLLSISSATISPPSLLELYFRFVVPSGFQPKKA